nr:tryptophan 2,3-dioxygenase family protein [Bacteroidota bacterium]
IYHQITELYFKLSLWEVKQIIEHENIDATFMAERLRRMNSYFNNLTKSFEIMVEGMEAEQFLKFRLTLMPASGFQSAQYRMLEIASTDLINLVEKSHRPSMKEASIEEQYGFMYWRYGATEVATGRKTLTLRRFEVKYADTLIAWAKLHQDNNLWLKFKSISPEAVDYDKLESQMKEWDTNVNIRWPIVHLRSAGRYLGRQDKGIPATGGTNWQKYLAPRFQQRVFFPALWTEDELENWGSQFKDI